MTVSFLITVAVIFICFGLGWLLGRSWERRPIVSTRSDIMTSSWLKAIERIEVGQYVTIDRDGYVRGARYTDMPEPNVECISTDGKVEIHIKETPR
jgi:hypothetical protein